MESWRDGLYRLTHFRRGELFGVCMILLELVVLFAMGFGFIERYNHYYWKTFCLIDLLLAANTLLCLWLYVNLKLQITYKGGFFFRRFYSFAFWTKIVICFVTVPILATSLVFYPNWMFLIQGGLTFVIALVGFHYWRAVVCLRW